MGNCNNSQKRIQELEAQNPGRMAISVQEHEKIIEAFRRKDADLAETLVRKNAEYGGRVLMDGVIPAKKS